MVGGKKEVLRRRKSRESKTEKNTLFLLYAYSADVGKLADRIG